MRVDLSFFRNIRLPHVLSFNFMCNLSMSVENLAPKMMNLSWTPRKTTIFADFTRRTTLKEFLLTRTELNQSVFKCIVSSWCLPFISMLFQASREVQDGQKTSNSAGGGPDLPIFGTFANGLIPHGDGSTRERFRRCSLRPTT